MDETLAPIRALLRDPSGAVWSDADLRAFRTLAADDPYGTAALALRALAADRARGFKRTKDEGQEFERYSVSELMAAADAMDVRAGAFSSTPLPALDGSMEAVRPLWEAL